MGPAGHWHREASGLNSNGVPREIKTGEQRVALTPAGAHSLGEHGHRVLIEEGAGLAGGIRDEE